MLKVTNLSVTKRCMDISFSANHGEYWHLLGANGSGKSTLLFALAGILESTGSIVFNGQDVAQIPLPLLAEFRCLLPQQHQIQFDITAEQAFLMLHQISNVPQPLVQHLKLDDVLPKSMLLLSGGELQRVYVALHLAQVWQPITRGEALVMLDEPTQQLDPQYQERVLMLLQSIAQLGNIVIHSHHDVNQTLRYATHAGLLKLGSLEAIGEVDKVVNEHQISAIYDQPFVQLQMSDQGQRYLVISDNQQLK